VYMLYLGGRERERERERESRVRVLKYLRLIEF